MVNIHIHCLRNTKNSKTKMKQKMRKYTFFKKLEPLDDSDMIPNCPIKQIRGCRSYVYIQQHPFKPGTLASATMCTYHGFISSFFDSTGCFSLASEIVYLLVIIITAGRCLFHTSNTCLTVV